MRTESTAFLCNFTARTDAERASLLEELARRGAISNGHIAQIKEGHIAVGMNACETTLAWGLPTSFSDSPEMDFAVPSTAGVTMVYTYWGRATVYFGADGRVKSISRKY